MRLGVGPLLVLAIGLAMGTSSVSASPPNTPPSEDSLRRLLVEVHGQARPLSEVRLLGLRRVSEEQLWAVLGGRPQGPWAFERVLDVVRGLETLDSFSRIEPRLRVVDEGRVEIDIHLEEQPGVEEVRVSGLIEASESEVLGALVGPLPAVEREGAPLPSWLARIEGGVLKPGILSGGVARSVQRVIQSLFVAGRRMATVRGHLSSDGHLTLDVDEGRLGELRLVGPPASLDPQIRELLNLPPGRTFLEADVDEAVGRLRKNLPFLEPSRASRLTRAVPNVLEHPSADGGIDFRVVEVAPNESPTYFEVEGTRLTVHLRSHFAAKVRVAPDDLLRHTPVGGPGAGAQVQARFWDPQARVHAEIATFLSSVNKTTRDEVAAESLESNFSLRFQVPRLRIAEMGFEAHEIFESPDLWRMKRQSSYLNSLFFNLADAEYYVSKGNRFFLTALPTRRLLLGIEHDDSKHLSVASLERRQSLSGDPFSNPPIDDGRISSLLFRGELSSDDIRPADLSSVFRSPDTSLVKRPRAWGLRSGYQTLLTVELARRGLGTDPGLTFTRLVSDSVGFLATGAESGLRVRARFAGGSNLPRQKREALGGWAALRGWDFKELRNGDRSALAMIEYRHDWVSGFLDVGAVRQPELGWTGPRFGAGAKLHLESLPLLGPRIKQRRRIPPIELAVAWRLNGFEANPSVRLLIGHLF